MSNIEDRTSTIGNRHVIWNGYNIELFEVAREQSSFHATRFNIAPPTCLQTLYMASHVLRQQAGHTIVPIAGGWFLEHGARSVDRLLAGDWGMSIGLAVDVNILWL